jgi:methylmalonyl-CoA mutase
MPDVETGMEILHLGPDFPATPTEEWEAAIHRDLKGADYGKKLVWRTEEGIAVRPYYRREDLAGLEAQTGSVPAEFPFVRGSGKAWEFAQEEAPAPDAIRGDRLHEAGANSVQELGYAIAAGAERLDSLTAQGQPVAEAARSIEFVFGIGSNYFFEIAKLRAARMLWAQVVAAFAPDAAEAALMRVHARTSRLNKSVYDPYTNLLRVTTEALSAAIGGCEKLTVEPFGFDAHLALNVQRILKHESHLDAVADPAAGSYYIEALTDAIAREAWALFQQVEADGGYRRALASGAVETALAQSRVAREKAVASRRRTMVGVNNYPDLSEKEPQAEPPPPDTDPPLPAWRMAEPFERIRARTIRHARSTGRYPRVLLLKRGDVKMRMARANFVLNFFGCAGFDIAESEEFTGTDADLIVLCSSDPEYLPLAQNVCPQVKVPVIVAGNPKDKIEALEDAGVQGFVHIMSDAVETLTRWQNRLGMKE